MSHIDTRRLGAGATAGFTLVELLIALVVVAILAAVALPSYQDSVRKGRRAEAFAALTAVQQAQERWRSNRASYTTELTAAPTADPPGLGLPATTAKGYYAIAIDAASATGYTVTATGVDGTSQAADGNCRRLRVRVAGGNIFYGSASATGDFDESATNRCWAR